MVVLPEIGLSGRRFVFLKKWVTFTLIFSIAESLTLGVLDGATVTKSRFVEILNPVICFYQEKLLLFTYLKISSLSKQVNLSNLWHLQVQLPGYNYQQLRFVFWQSATFCRVKRRTWWRLKVRLCNLVAELFSSGKQGSSIDSNELFRQKVSSHPFHSIQQPVFTRLNLPPSAISSCLCTR